MCSDLGKLQIKPVKLDQNSIRRESVIFRTPSQSPQDSLHTDSVEHFDDFRRRKSGQNDDFRGRFYAVAEFASLGAENGYCLTIFGAENRAKMTILGTNR